VPIVALTAPGRVIPIPTAPAAWSPAPATIGVPAGTPIAVAPSGETRAQISGDSNTGGSSRRSIPTRSSRSRDQRARHVEHQRAGRVGDVDRVLAAQPPTDVVLRQQHVAHARQISGSCGANPEQLGQREVGQRGIRRELEQRLAPIVRRASGIRLRSLIAPDDRRPQHACRGIEQHGAVHLP
jgi:hypothetical protein